MLMTLIQKEMMHHILSARFVALLLMCLLLVPLTLHINYSNYRQNLVDYQEAIKRANIEEAEVNPKSPTEPEEEVSKVFLKPTPLSVFANGLENVLPSYLGMTRNGITQGPDALIASPLSYLLGHLDFHLCGRNSFQSVGIAVYIRCRRWGERSRDVADYLSERAPARRIPMEKIDWRIPCELLFRSWCRLSSVYS